MDGIDPQVIADHFTQLRKKAIDDVHYYSLVLDVDDPCLNREQRRALCAFFGVDSLAQVFAILDDKEAA